MVPSRSAPAFPVVITVPVASGKVIVLSPVGSATVRVVSCASAVAPSKRSVLPVFRKRPSFLILATISFDPSDIFSIFDSNQLNVYNSMLQELSSLKKEIYQIKLSTENLNI